jgi:hypothetical protein
MSSIGYHQFEVEYEKKKYSGDPDRVTKSETYKIPKEFHGQQVGSHNSIMNRIKGHAESAATHNKHKAAGFNVSEKPIKFKSVNEEIQIDEISTKTALSYVSKAGNSQDKLDTTTDDGHRKFWNRQKGQALALDKTNPAWKRLKAKVGTTKEEVEPLDEISRDLASRYIQKAKTSTRDAYYGDDAPTSNKRKKGIDLALLKKWGDKKYGFPEPKVKATEDVDTARAAHAKAKELEDKGHEAERMGDEKKMRGSFAAMALQKLKSREAMKKSTVKEAAEPKPKSMVPQAREELKKTKELYKKVDAISKEMKNPGYDVNDRVNHFRLKKHIHDLYLKKRQDISSKSMNEEVEIVEAGQDRHYHEFWAERTSRQIAMLKKKGKAIPDSLRMKYQKHKQALQSIKSGKGTQIAVESADVRTLNSGSRDITTTTRIGPDGRVKLVKRKMPRTEIEIGKKAAAIPEENDIEEKLNRLYESLSDKNKVKFMEKVETEEGIKQLIKFAEDQGF